MPPVPERACFRCHQPLAAGTSFCVSCGCVNDADSTERLAGAMQQADERIAWARWRRGFFRLLSGLFRAMR